MTARTRAKRIAAWPLRWVRGLRRPPTRWVLTFHEVGDHPWATPPEAFDGLLAGIASAARVVPLSDLVAAPDDGERRAAITFDDGYVGVASRAAPALSRAGLPATCFLPTDLLAEGDAVPRADRALYEGVPLMGWSTVRRLVEERSPLSFESHGAAHVALTTLPEDARRDDLRRSREAIAAATGSPPRFLAFPFGAADAATAATARDAGFEAAFTTRHGGLRAGNDPFRLPRVDVRADYAPRDVRAMLEGDWDFLGWTQSLRSARG
jgi:peptidoglycan/xylan/chitin deacetylase (PgdA/CDA1 family)